MKNKLLSTAVSLGLAAALTNTPARADCQLTAAIPFTFEAGGVHYPEGNYVVERVNGGRLLKMTSKATGRAIFVSTPISRAAEVNPSTRLVFTHTVGGLRLEEAWFNGLPGSLTMPGSTKAGKAWGEVVLKLH